MDLGQPQSPVQELGSRLTEAAESLAATDRRRREQAFRATFDRFLALAPTDWPIKRSVAQQVQQQAGGIKQVTLRNADFLEPRKAVALLRLIETAEDRGISPTRSYLLAQIVRRRDVFDRNDIRRILAVSQAHYFKAGTEAHAAPETGFDACRLYPGPFFTRWLPQAGIAGLPMPEVDSDLTFGEMGRRLAAVGVDLQALLGLSAGNLHEIVITPEWRRIREAVTAPGQSLEAAGDGSLREAIGTLPRPVTIAGQRATAHLRFPTVFIPEWRRAVWSTVGTVSLAAAPTAPATVTIDLSMHAASRGALTLPLTRGELTLLTLFAACGAGGLHVEDVMSFLDEEDVLDGTTPERPVRRAPRAIGTLAEEEYAGLRNRTDVSLHRLAGTLAPLGIKITHQPEDGRYLLEIRDAAEDQDALVEWRVSNSPWNDPDSGSAPVIGTELSPQQTKVFLLLAGNMPDLVPAARIAGELGMAEQADSNAAISKIIHALNVRLRKHGVPWRVFSNRHGGYALVPDGPCSGAEKAG